MKTNRLTRMGRRRFLKTLSQIGLSTSAIAGLTQEKLAALTDNPEKEVPRLGWYRHTNQDEVREGTAAPKREPIYYTIPRDEWLQTEGAYKAAEDISKDFQDPYIQVGVTNQGNNSGLSVLVQKIIVRDSTGTTISSSKMDRATSEKSISEIKQKVPEKTNVSVDQNGTETKVEDIPVVVENQILPEESQRGCNEDPSSGSYYDDVYRPVPGGCKVGGALLGTFGSPAYSRNINDYVMITAAHVVGRTDGTDMYQNPSASEPVGVSTTNYIQAGDGDAAEVEINESYATYSVGSLSGGYGRDIAGSVGRDRVADLTANGSNIYVQGAKTGRHNEPVANHITNADEGGDKIEVLASTEGGDSGGPYYEIQNGDAYTVGIHAWGPCIGGIKAASGNTMYYIEKELDVYV